MDNINKIIENCKKNINFWPNYAHFIVEQLSDFIHNQSNDDQYIIKTNKIPLLYFFDKYLNENIHISVTNRDNFLRTINSAYQFYIDNNYIHNVIIDKHAVILYTITYNERNYVYLSNSGLGIGNQNTNINKTSCKLFYVKGLNSRYEIHTMFLNIIQIINLISKFSPVDYINYPDSHISKKALHDNINSILLNIKTKFVPNLDTNIMSKSFLSIFYQDILDNDKTKIKQIGYINLIYIMLNYIFQLDFMTECSFHHILNGNDHPRYSELVRPLIYNNEIKFTFHELYNNCINDYNSHVYSALRHELDEKIPHISNNFINDINQKLDEYAKLKKTIEFKRDSIIIELYNSGLYNYVQVGGSCVFYCFYNLLINNLFLKNYILYTTNKEKAVKNVINTLLYIHYTLLEHLCMCNDIYYLNLTNNFYPNHIFHINYIYNIMIKNNLMEEITNFYPSSNLMFFSKTPLIDKLLEFKLNNDIFILNEGYALYTRNDVMLMKSHFNEINKLINDYLFKIRSLEVLSEKSLVNFRNKLYSVYKLLITILVNTQTNFTYCIKYLEISRDIIIIYCYYLWKLYSKRIAIFKYIKKTNVINLLYPVYWLPDDIELSNCGASNDCKIKNCDVSVYDTFYEYNIDFILNKLNNYEIYCISSCLKKFDVDIKTKITLLLKLEQCNNITVGILSLNRFDFDFYNDNIYYKYDDNSISLKRLISKYFRNKYLSMNLSINQQQREIYIKKCDYIIKKIKEDIIKNVDITSLSTFKANIIDIINYLHEFINFKTILLILLFILSNGKYVFLSNEICGNVMFFNFLSIINDNVKIFYDNDSNEFILEKIYNFLVENTQLDINNNSISEHIEWINKYNIIYQNINYNNILFEYNNDSYVHDLKLSYESSLSLILARFGLHIQNYDEYILLIPEKHLISEIYLRSNISFTFFICIKKTKMIIEINIVNDKVDLNNCYLLKNEIRHKLLFNIQYPFIKSFTETTPYLCYIYNNTLFVDIIVSDVFWLVSSSKNYKYLLYKKDINYIDYYCKFDILEFEIAYSMTFPTIKTNNIDSIKTIHHYYPTNDILKFSKKQLVKQDIFIELTLIDQITQIVKKIATILCKNINCDEKTDIIFKEVFEDELTKLEQRNAVLESFLKDNRLCIRFDFNDDIIFLQDEIILELKRINEQIKINYNFDKPQFIIDNITYIIVSMEINNLINEMNKINSNTTCWDIQSLLTKLDNIILFNDDIKNNKYYLYELLFLFQNNYFFKECQLDKYKSILHDIKTNNSSLTIHQFMMGKGKTSFLTPLLSMAINIFSNKTAIVITTEHLVLQTIKFMRYVHYLGDIPFVVTTDYNYKHFWLQKTDINIETFNNNHQIYIENILNTSLIIDEFNSHYDYTQSMFNLVKNQEYISQELFNYIFDYIYSKIADKPFTPSDISKLDNLIVLNSILDKEYTTSITLKYNEKYGFTNIIGDLRLCIPYARKDTPLVGSRFSSIILTIILTINYYITINKYKLDDTYDYPLIIDNYAHIIRILPIELFDEWYNYIEINKKLDIEIIKITFEKLYSELEVYVPILKKILYIINKSGLVYATEQYNVSFQDIIYNVYPNQWKVGYTGTIYLNPDIYFKDDTFVFKNKIEDFDERIEVKLAMEGYGSSIDWNNNVVIINTDNQNTVVEQINTILSMNINRGIVDIAGLFIDYKNSNIAKELHTLIPEKNIVYLSENHEGLEYYENTYNKYKPFSNDNFYYYDQCHIVGTDLEQPNQGYIAVIINKHTKWTEFSQGIFRFRKLNRGTYLKIFYITNDREILKTDLNNNDIIELLEKNETNFEKSNELGIKFQLFKAMVRNLSKNYLEDSLINEFLLENTSTIEDCKKFIINNVKDISNLFLLDDTHNPYIKYIKDLYQDIISHEDLIEIIIGSRSIKKQIDMEIMENKNIQKLSIQLIKYDDIITYRYDIITHLNCKKCIDTTSVPLFLNNYNCFINRKPIYVSLNISLGYINEIIDTSLLIFVELPNIIIIEIEHIAYDYYSHKFPIYDFDGTLLNTFLKNNISHHPFKLDIDYRFLYLFNLINYINPIKDKNLNIITESIINEIENNLNHDAVKIFFLLSRKLPEEYNNFYDATPIIQYLTKIYVTDDIIKLINITEKDNNEEHDPDYRLDNIFINIYSNINGINLSTAIYPAIKRVPFQIIYNNYYHRLNNIVKI
jgi:hypothetical protein